MSKPLELTVYDCEDCGDTSCFIIEDDKRLTDAELAAEYYAQDSKCRHEQWIETVRGDGDYTDEERAGQSRMYEQLTALHRFATMAHYDQEEAQT